jgi:hypothetical protein
MNLYFVEDESEEFQVFVAANSYSDAIERWKRVQIVSEENDERVNEFMLIPDPKAVILVAEGDDFIL